MYFRYTVINARTHKGIVFARDYIDAIAKILVDYADANDIKLVATGAASPCLEDGKLAH